MRRRTSVETLSKNEDNSSVDQILSSSGFSSFQHSLSKLLIETIELLFQLHSTVCAPRPCKELGRQQNVGTSFGAAPRTAWSSGLGRDAWSVPCLSFLRSHRRVIYVEADHLHGIVLRKFGTLIGNTDIWQKCWMPPPPNIHCKCRVILRVELKQLKLLATEEGWLRYQLFWLGPRL